MENVDRISDILQFPASGPSVPSTRHLSSHSPALSDQGSAGPSKPRAARACSSCSRQKLKCDGLKPCSRCVMQGVSDECGYLPSMRGKMRGKRKRPRATPPEDANDNVAHSNETNTIVDIGDEDRAALRDFDGRGKLPRSGSFGMRPPPNQVEGFLQWQRSSRPQGDGPRIEAFWKDQEGGEYQERGEDKGHQPAKMHRHTTHSPVTNHAPMRDRQHMQNESTAELSASRAVKSPLLPRRHSASHSDSGCAQSPMDVADKLTTLPLPGDHNPLAVLAEASASVVEHDPNDQTGPVHTSSERGAESRKGEAYYTPLARTLKEEAPHIMAHINVHEAEKLFDLYFTYLHPHLPLLDISHSSPSAVARRNNFLFNAICCASARAFNIVLWTRLAEFARFEVERLPKEKNIDVIQGHLIYATWNLHRPKNFELDMTWLRIGLAVRTAIDINLHRAVLIKQARDGLPKWVVRAMARTWLGTYIADRTMSAQLGKPSTMRGERSITLYIELLRNPGSYSSPSVASESNTYGPSSDDLWIAALAEWTQMLSRSIDSFRSEALADEFERVENPGGSGLANGTAFPDLVKVFDRQFASWRNQTEKAIEASDPKGLPTANLDAAKSPSSDSRSKSRTGRVPENTSSPQGRNSEKSNTYTSSSGVLGLPFMLANIRIHEQYARLVVQSFGLEKAVENSPIDLPAALIEYQSAAARIIHTFRSTFDATSILRLGATDAVFTFLTYATVSLLRVLLPQFAHLEPDRVQVLDLAREAADMLARAAMTPDHLPAGQSMFLSRLIQVHASRKKPQQQSAGTETAQFESGGGAHGNRSTLTSGGPAFTGHDQLQFARDFNSGPSASLPTNLQDFAPAEWLSQNIDFEAFGQLLDRDQGRSVWPPTPSLTCGPFGATQTTTADAAQSLSLNGAFAPGNDMSWITGSAWDHGANTLATALLDHSGPTTLQSADLNRNSQDATKTPLSGETAPSLFPKQAEEALASNSAPNVDSRVLEQRDSGASGHVNDPFASMSASGPGLDLDMSLYGAGDDDMLFTQDSFWGRLLNGVPPPGMV